MLQSKWLHSIKYFRLEFWLSLPILGIAFWFFCGWATQEALIKFSNENIKPEVFVKQQNSSYSQEYLSIRLKAHPQKDSSIVTITKQITGKKTKGVKILELEFLTTDVQTIETEISKELQLSPEEVRKLMMDN